MNPFEDFQRYETRRQFFARGKSALGYAALASLLGPSMKLWSDDAQPVKEETKVDSEAGKGSQ